MFNALPACLCPPPPYLWPRRSVPYSWHFNHPTTAQSTSARCKHKNVACTVVVVNTVEQSKKHKRSKEEKKHKHSKEEKKHKHSKEEKKHKHSKEEKKHSAKRPKQDTELTPPEKQISKDDYFLKAAEFRVWLKREKYCPVAWLGLAR